MKTVLIGLWKKKRLIIFLVIAVVAALIAMPKGMFLSPVKKSEIIFSDHIVSKISIQSTADETKLAKQTVMSFMDLGLKLGFEIVEVDGIGLIKINKDFFNGNISIEGRLDRKVYGDTVFFHFDGVISVDSKSQQYNSKQKLASNTRIDFKNSGIVIHTTCQTALAAAARDSNREWALRLAAEKMQSLIATKLLF